MVTIFAHRDIIELLQHFMYKCPHPYLFNSIKSVIHKLDFQKLPPSQDCFLAWVGLHHLRTTPVSYSVSSIYIQNSPRHLWRYLHEKAGSWMGLDGLLKSIENLLTVEMFILHSHATIHHIYGIKSTARSPGRDTNPGGRRLVREVHSDRDMHVTLALQGWF